MDETLEHLMPNAASIKYCPLVASSQPTYMDNQFFKDAFEAINEQIRSRPHVDMDSYEPIRRRLLKDHVHMKNMEGIEFWRKIFKQL